MNNGVFKREYERKRHSLLADKHNYSVTTSQPHTTHVHTPCLFFSCISLHTYSVFHPSLFDCLSTSQAHTTHVHTHHTCTHTLPVFSMDFYPHIQCPPPVSLRLSLGRLSLHVRVCLLSLYSFVSRFFFAHFSRLIKHMSLNPKNHIQHPSTRHIPFFRRAALRLASKTTVNCA